MVEGEFDCYGCVCVLGLVLVSECDEFVLFYLYDVFYCLCVVMVWYGFGCGEYKYFVYLLFVVIVELCVMFYLYFVLIVNCWN